MLRSSPLRANAIDLLRVPLLGRFLRWKHSRTALQIPLFLVAIAIIVDGLLGSSLANKNTATVGAWVHYRGFVVLALLLVGNLFCAACPFMLPRKVAKWIGRPTRRWPRLLRNKWPAIIGFVGIVYLYELFDLWASPWWTAWLVVAYFGAAFVLEALFTRDSFCLYVCPLGTFNFLYSTASPFQITARNLNTCATCVGHDCINGNSSQIGCQLELYVPTIKSNMNCTLCLDCAKACPHDNVMLASRPPGDELFRQSWPHRLDLALLAVIATFIGLVNAFAMTPPVYRLEAQMAALLNTTREALVLGIIFVVGAVLLPMALAFGAAAVSNIWSKQAQPVKRTLMDYAYAFVPMGFAVWTAHYLFHFLTGAMTIVPAIQTFWSETVGLPILGTPNWTLAQWFVPPVGAIQTIQLVIVVVGTVAGGWLMWQTAARHNVSNRRDAWRAAGPWLFVLALVAIAAIYVFLLPMEMRGSALSG